MQYMRTIKGRIIEKTDRNGWSRYYIQVKLFLFWRSARAINGRPLEFSNPVAAQMGLERYIADEQKKVNAKRITTKVIYRTEFPNDVLPE